MSKGTNWANRTKAAVAAVPLEKRSTKDRGKRHTGVIESFTPKFYKTGGFGIEIKYSLEGLERPVYENVVLRTIDKATGNPRPTKFGLDSYKRRLQAVGMTAEEVAAFPVPITAADAEDEAYKSLAGAPVAVYVRDVEYMGKPKKEVASVWPIEFDNTAKNTASE